MKTQSNFLSDLIEKYGEDYRVHSYGQFVQVSAEKDSGETLSFHFNEKGFFDGAYYKPDLHNKGWGNVLIGYDKESKFYVEKSPEISEKMVQIWDDIYAEFGLAKWLDDTNKKLETWKKEKGETTVEREDAGEEVKATLFKVNKESVFLFQDKTFIEADKIPHDEFVKIENIKGVEAINIADTKYKDWDAFRTQSKMMIFVDTPKFNQLVEKYGADTVAVLLNEAFPEISKENSEKFVAFMQDRKNHSGKEDKVEVDTKTAESKEAEEVEKDEDEMER